MRRPARALSLAALSLVVLLVAGGCTTSPATAPAPAATTSAPAASSSGSAGTSASDAPGSAAPGGSGSEPPSSTSTPAAAPSPTPTAKPKPPHPISIAALTQKKYDGRDLKLGRSLGDFGAYERYIVTFRGDGLKVSGVMNVPDGDGPFPVLVLNHGYIDPDVYRPGQGMAREQDYLARQGYVVLHVDYRNHATSDNDSQVDYELRLPYAVDTINAVKAVKASKLPFLDGERVGWLGRSMGGAVTLTALVAQPGLVDAAAIYASTSSLAADNWRQFYRRAGDRRAVNERIEETYGLPQDNPAFWRAASPRPYFDRVTEPVLVLHGARDDTCPIAWSRDTVEALEKEGVEVTLRTYRNEGHTFYNEWQNSIETTADFFERHLD